MRAISELLSKQHRLAAANPWLVASLVLAFGSVATLAGALFFEMVVNLPPCPLCLEQRVPYYLVAPAAGLLGFVASRGTPACVARGGLLALAALMGWGMSMGIYHAGAEWAFWPGPNTCATVPAAPITSTTGLLAQMRETRVVDCTVAAWRFLGLSLAGWNVVVAGFLAAVALWGAGKAPRAAS